MAFDKDLSLRLDRIIIELERRPPVLRRFVLRVVKRWLERGVPVWK